MRHRPFACNGMHERASNDRAANHGIVKAGIVNGGIVKDGAAPRPGGVARRLRRLLVLCAVAYAIVCAAAWALQEHLVYVPGPPPTATPADRGVPFEEIWLEVDGERLHLWWLPARTAAGAAPRGAVVLCHGNAGSIQGRIGLGAAWAARGFDVALFDYRGYGASDGAPSEAGTYADARAVYAYTVDERGHAHERVIVHGRSLGGAVAVDLAAARPVGGLVLEATFTSLPDVGAAVYPWLPVRLLSRIRYPSIEKIAAIDAPLFAAHDPEDRIVPFELGERLFERAREPKVFVELEGGHNGPGIDGTEAARAALDAWLDAHLGAR